MSLLKVNNPRSLLRKAEQEKSPKIVTIRSNDINKKIVIDVVKPPQTQTSSTNKKNNPPVVKEEQNPDEDLKMPSELFDCNFTQEKVELKNVSSEFYFETDHEALRGNSDYHKLMKTYALLQAKKVQVRYLGVRVTLKCAINAKKRDQNISTFNICLRSLDAQEIDRREIDPWVGYQFPALNTE